MTTSLSPVEDARISRATAAWRRRGYIAIAGAAGSGRGAFARALASSRTSRVIEISCEPEQVGEAYGVVTRILDADVHESHAPDAVARLVLDRIDDVTIILRDAQHADPLSLRTLASLTRRRTSVRVAVTIEHGPAEDVVVRAMEGITIEALGDLAPDDVERITRSSTGTHPTPLSVHALHRWSRGGFRALRWLLELAELTNAWTTDHGHSDLDIAKMRRPSGVPAWSINPSILAHSAAQVLALCEVVPINTLAALDMLDAAERLETSGAILVGHDGARLSSRACSIDVAARLGRLTKLRLVHALGALPEASWSPASASVLVDSMLDLGITPSSELIARAVLHLSHSGEHERACGLASDLAYASPDLLLSTVIADPLTARAIAGKLDRSDADAVEAGALALGIGALRDDLTGHGAALLDDYIAERIDACTPGTRAVLERTRALVHGERAIKDDGRVDWLPHSVARVARLEALQAWLEGRPITATAALESLGDEAPRSAADAAIELFTRVASAILTPDLDAAAALLVRLGDTAMTSLTGRLLWATHAMLSGEVASARVMARPLLADSTAAVVAAPLLSIASSMLEDRDAAQRYLDESYNVEVAAGMHLDASGKHLRGIAGTQLRDEPRHDEGLALYADAADAADDLGFRLLFATASHRRAHELGKGRDASVLKELTGLLGGEEAVEGVPRLFANMADALIRKDVRAMLGSLKTLQEAGLAQDTRVIASRVAIEVGTSLPKSITRAIRRLSRAPFGEDAATSMLTPREREVAGLMLAGRTDRAIAGQLGCSPRTVNVHVGRILRKLELRSRYELTHEVAEANGVSTLEPR